MRAFGVGEARKRLKQIINQTETTDAVIALERHGQPVAIVLSVARYRKLLGEGAALLAACEHGASQRMKQALDLGQALTRLKTDRRP
jgi:prevent-host-death family protein